MKRYLAKNFGIVLQDKIKKTNIKATFEFLKESQYWDEDKINEYQLIKLKNIIDYSSKNVPYYEQLFKRIKINSDDIKSLEDINKIPILTKEIVQKESTNMVSRLINSKVVKKGKTGGTTGVPTILYKDVNNRSFTWGSYYRWYEWMGLNYFDPTATFWGAKAVLSNSLKEKIKTNLTSFVQNNIILDSFNINEKMANTYYKAILKLNPFLIKGYVSSMLDFAKYVDKNKWTFASLKAISTTTETLLPSSRKYLEQIFKVPVFDQYGCGEVSAISYECSKHNGLHINQEHVICEILDKENNPIINQSGRVVTTDLDNYVMPFIRYENGDLATLTDKKCSCGIKHPLMKSIEGRAIDTVTLNNGIKVHGVFFTDILFEIGMLSNEFSKFQVIQNKIGSIKFRLEIQNPLVFEKKEKLLKSLSKFFNNVELIEEKKIRKESNGKFKYIINNIPE